MVLIALPIFFFDLKIFYLLELERKLCDYLQNAN